MTIAPRCFLASCVLVTGLVGQSLQVVAQDKPSVSAEIRILANELIDGEALEFPSNDQNPAKSENEPNNNRFGLADDFNLGDNFVGTISPKGDVDWLRMRASRPGELILSTKTAPSELNLAVRIWDTNGKHLTGWITASGNGADLRAVVDLPSAGDFVFEIRDGSNDAASDTAYEFELAFTPVPELNEQQNSFARPTIVPIKAFPLSILPKGDVDFIAIDAPQQGQLSITVAQPPENLDVSVRVWDPNGKHLTGWLKPLAVGGPLETIADLPRRGRYTLEVRDGNNDSRSIEPFEMALAFVPTDAQEPNDQWRSATVLGIGQELQAAILPKGDVDYYVIDLPNAESRGIDGRLDRVAR